MRKKIITHLVLFFLVIFSNNLYLLAENSAYEEQLLKIAQSNEKKGKFEDAYKIYASILKDNSENLDARQGLKRLKNLSSFKPKSSKSTKKTAIPKKNNDFQKNKGYYSIQFLTSFVSYRKQANRKLKKLEKQGFSCYLKEGKQKGKTRNENYLYLRCNPVKNRNELKPWLKIARNKNLDHFVVKDTLPDDLVEENQAGEIPPVTINESKSDNSNNQLLLDKISELEAKLDRLAKEKNSNKTEEVKKIPISKTLSRPNKPSLNLQPLSTKPNLTTNKRPSVGGNNLPPSMVKKPSTGGNNLPPSMVKRPSTGGNNLPPSMAKRPSTGGNNLPPSMVKKPSTGGNNLPPSMAKKPSAGGNNLPPNMAKGKKPPSMASRPKLAVAGQKKASKYTIKDGFDAVNTKQLKKAKTIFSELVAMNRTDPDANFGLALVFMQEGDWDKAARIIKSVLPHTDRKDIHDTYTSVLYNLHLKNGWKAVATAPEKSAKEFLKAKKIKSDSPDVAEGLSYAYNNAKKPDLAIPYVLQTYKNKPNFKTAEMVIKTYLAAEKKLEAEKFFNTLDPLIQVNMEFNPNRDRAIKEIEGHLKENQYRQAMSKLREIYLMYPTDLKVLFYMGKAYAGQDKTKRALEYFKTVLKRKPDHKEALTEVAHIYMKDEKDEKALEILHVLQKANVKVDHFVEQIELRLFIKNKNYKEAEKLAKKMIANDPTNVKYYIILGDITKKDGRKRESYFYYAKAYQLEPNRFKVRMELLDLLLEQKLFDQVQIILEKFRGYEMTEDQTQELRTFYESYYKTYAAYSLGEEEYLDALRAAKAGLQMMPNDMGLMETAGWAGLNGKKYTDAVYFFKKIASQDLTAYSQRYGLGLAYVNMKQKNKALLAFQEAEQTQDRELLLKIAEIYKDIGEDKHAFRVIKRLEKQSSAPVGMPQTKTVKTNKSSRDDMNVYNPFLGSLVPTAQPEPATPSIGSNNLQTLQPNNPNNIMFTSPIQQPTSLKKKW